MPSKESFVPQDWFRKADADIQTVEILLAHGGDLEMAAMHVQQAIEKYLKGYLLSRGWKFDRIHDLPSLLDEAVTRNANFEKFRELCENVTAFYFEARYPFVVQPPTEEKVKDALERTKQLIQFILAEHKSQETQPHEPDENASEESKGNS
jgi:HEPN domain-containing protein